MPTTQPLSGLAQEMKTAFVRYCGEQRIAYNTDVLELLGKVGAGVANARQARREPKPVSIPALAPVEPIVPAMPFDLDLEQVDLLELVAEGFSDERIARRLGVSVYLAKKRIRRLLTALDADCRTSAVALGYEFGILGPGPRAARKRSVRPPAASGDAHRPGLPSASRWAPGGPDAAPEYRHSRTQVLKLLVEGLDIATIQQRLNLTTKQVKYRIQYWYQYSGTQDRPALIAWAKAQVLIGGPEATR